MSKITFTFEGSPHEFHAALRQMGLTGVPGEPLREWKTGQFGDSPEQLANGTSSGAPAEEESKVEETHSGPHSPEDIAAALATVVDGEKEAKRKAAADKRAKKAEEKRQASAQSRIASANTDAEESLAADPNGASLEALLSQDPADPIPETPVVEEPAPEEEDLAALLGDTSNEDPNAEKRAELDTKSDAELLGMLKDMANKRGVIWLKAVLNNIGRPSLAKITREETIEALLSEG